MIALGIETSCDETSVSVVRDGRQILSNTVVSSIKAHRPYGGVVPEIASRCHLEAILPCLESAVKKSGVGLKKIDLVCVTNGPGLMGSLLVGLSAAKALAMVLKKPLIGVDHVAAHAYSGVLAEPALRGPWVSLVASGGHTLLLKMSGPDRLEVLGSTIDDAAGEAFDKVAKILGLGYPGGPEIDRLSRGIDPDLCSFTRPFLSNESLDFSFSGIKTAVLYKVEKLKKEGRLTQRVKREVCSGFQEAVCEVLAAKTVRAAKRCSLKTIVIGGGVSANQRLRYCLNKAAAQFELHLVFPPLSLCQDNGAMIASLGTALYQAGRRDRLSLAAYSDFEDALKTRALDGRSWK